MCGVACSKSSRLLRVSVNWHFSLWCHNGDIYNAFRILSSSQTLWHNRFLLRYSVYLEHTHTHRPKRLRCSDQFGLACQKIVMPPNGTIMLALWQWCSMRVINNYARLANTIDKSIAKGIGQSMLRQNYDYWTRQHFVCAHSRFWYGRIICDIEPKDEDERECNE